MLNMYFEDIRKYGNDPMKVGVDGILKKYSQKYLEYETLFGNISIALKDSKSSEEPSHSPTAIEKELRK